VFIGADSFQVFDQDGNTLGVATKVRGDRKSVGCQVDLRDAEVRAVVRLAARESSWRGLVWKYVVCTPGGEEVATLIRRRGWRAAQQCTVTRGAERIATLEKGVSARLATWRERFLGPHQCWRLRDDSGCGAARITLAHQAADGNAYVLEVESWVTGPLRVIALAACVVVDQGMASF
jgi:hypothetical protein